MYWHLLCKIAHVIVALSAINIGLTPHGYNVCSNQSFVGACGQYMVVGSYLIGICGVICLLHIFYKVSMCRSCWTNKCGCVGKCTCGASNDKCNTNSYK